jgi:hypothetical protein
MGDKTRHRYGLRERPKRNYASLFEESNEEEVSFVKRVKKEVPNLVPMEKPDGTDIKNIVDGIIPINEPATIKQDEPYEEGFLNIINNEVESVTDLSVLEQEEVEEEYNEIIDLIVNDLDTQPINNEELYNMYIVSLKEAIDKNDEATILSFLNYGENSIITSKDKLAILPELIDKNLVHSFSAVFEQLGVEAFNDQKVAEATLKNSKFVVSFIAKTFSVSNSCKDLEVKLYEEEKICRFTLSSIYAEEAAINLLFAIRTALGSEAYVYKNKIASEDKKLNTGEQSLELYFTCDFKNIDQVLICLRAIQSPSERCKAEMSRVQANRLIIE